MRVHKVFLLLSCLSVSSVLANFNFDNYPECAQNICYDLAPQSCDYPNFGDATDVEAEPTESCFCTNTAFIIDLAGQIFYDCGCRTLTTSAQVHNDYCAKLQTNSVVSVEDFISLGDEGVHTRCGSTGLGSGTIVGIVIGVLALVVAIVIGVL